MNQYQITFTDGSRITIPSHPPYLSHQVTTNIVFTDGKYTRPYAVEIIKDIKEILK